jgi:hydroxymethylpyrimidine kinase/phosphomethylpyrimidine kinase/thiamine-phosphate diphosphorylase
LYYYLLGCDINGNRRESFCGIWAMTAFFLRSLFTLSTSFSFVYAFAASDIQMPPRPPSVVLTIAGSDSGGGAGIQADLKAIHTISGGKCHGCSAITCLTAQNSCGVTGVHSPPVEFLRSQLLSVEEDLYPAAVKIGMLGTQELADEVGSWLRKLKENGDKRAPFVVVDPVMITTSGHKLVDDSAKVAMIDKVFPYADLVTPNKFEAEELLGKTLCTPQDVEDGARVILSMGPKAVIIKGGHSLLEGNNKVVASEEMNASVGYAQDYLLMSEESAAEGKPIKDKARLCDGSRGVWIRNDRYDSVHTHGTGCTLSSAIASAWALGQRERDAVASSKGGENVGALCAMRLVDACCIAKAYVNAGIARGVQLGKGPGPVVHTGFPNSYKNFPTIELSASGAPMTPFLAMQSYHSAKSSSSASSAPALGRILPIVDTVEWVEQLVSTPGIEDIQLRFKDTTDYAIILDRIKRSSDLCQSSGVRLWINDHWKAAIEAGGCFGIHLGQEDLASCVDAGGLDLIRDAGLAFGVSTHSYSELCAALGVRPSYISLGPVFSTQSKDVKFDPQGLETVRQWRSLIPPHIPLIAIGGINNADVAKVVREAGAECSAVIGAVTKATDVKKAVADLNAAMS